METANEAPSELKASVFRVEAIEGLRTRHGQPVALFGIGSWTLVLFLFLTLSAILAFLFMADFARKETVQGFLEPQSGSAAINVARPGRVTEIYIREGQEVGKGQRLMRVSLDTALGRGDDTLGDRLARANARQFEELATELSAAGTSSAAQRAELHGRIAGARAQIDYLGESLALQQQRLLLAQATLNGLKSLEGRGFVSAMRVRDKQAEVLASEQAIADLRRQIAQARSDVAATEATARQAEADAERSVAQLRGSRAVLEERRAQTEADRGLVLVAPYDGRVVTVRATVGSAVDPGTALATVLPRGVDLEAVLWVPSRAIGFVSIGDEVRLMFDPFPFQRFGTGQGVVRSVSSTPVDARELGIAELANEGTLYRVRVRLSAQSVDAFGKSWPLAPGSRLHADVILEHQSLMEWVLDPLQAFRKRGI